MASRGPRSRQSATDYYLHPLVLGIILAVLKHHGEKLQAFQSFYNQVLELCGLSAPEAKALTRDQLEHRLAIHLQGLTPKELAGLAKQAVTLLAPDGGLNTRLRDVVLAEIMRRLHGVLAFAHLMPALGVRAENDEPIRAVLRTAAGNADLSFDPVRFENYRTDVLSMAGLSKEALPLEQFFTHQLQDRILEAFHSLAPKERDRLSAQALNLMGPEGFQVIEREWLAFLKKSHESKSSGLPIPVSDTVKPPKAQTHELQQMAQPDRIVFKDGTLFKGSNPYRPLPLAAQLAQAPRQTLRDWIKNKTEFQGRPLQTYYLEPLDRYFVSEESIQRMANRFVKWREGEPAGPAGPVTIGKTKDQSGFLSTSDSARILGVSSRTAWVWASQAGKAPTDRPLDVIKCTTSDHFYIREKDVYDLKKSIPRSGLQRGRRPQGAKP